MLLLLKLLMLVALAVVIWKAAVLILRYRRRPQSGLKCETCRHCDLIDDDGVMCRYGATVTLKTRAHVNMCMDYEPD